MHGTNCTQCAALVSHVYDPQLTHNPHACDTHTIDVKTPMLSLHTCKILHVQLKYGKMQHMHSLKIIYLSQTIEYSLPPSL